MNTITVLNGYLAKDPVFYPGATPDKHKTVMVILDNRGKNPAGVERLTSIDVAVWGKYAQAAACHLHKGRCISFTGDLRSFQKNLGFKLPNGKDAVYTKMEVRIQSFKFGPETNKEALKRYADVLKECIAKGIPVTPELLNEKRRSATVDYNPALAAATGKYGHARVWDKATNKFMEPGAAVPQVAQAVAAAPAVVAAADESVDDLEKRLAAMKADQAKAMTAGEGEQNPFNV